MTTSESSVPQCPICYDTLGTYGGPATLPCGHNGCVQCFERLKVKTPPECPLCRQPFNPALPLTCNTELRDLIALATSMFLDEGSQKEGWEAFPTQALANQYYAADLKHSSRQQQPASNLNGVDNAPSAPLLPGFDRPSLSAAGHGGHTHASSLSENGNGRSQQLIPSGRAFLSGNSALSLPPSDFASLLDMAPPHWLPDSFAASCRACHAPFRPLTRLRHHCRLCGNIFCHSCSNKKALLPPKYGHRQPERVCGMCYTVLQPVQPFLASVLSKASQMPIQDAIDPVSLRSWVNLPWCASMEEDLFKAANVVKSFTQASRLQPEAGIPTAVLAGVRGLVVLSALRVGAGWSASFGTGVMVSRSEDGEWSAPCAMAVWGVGWGLQVGGELAELVLVLRSDEAVKAVCGTLRLGVSSNASVTMGPLGRHADATMLVGNCGTAAIYSYSCTRGMFLGASLQGTLMTTRDQVNLNFYGIPMTPKELLVDRAVAPPPAAAVLYDALHGLMHKFENRRLLIHSPGGSNGNLIRQLSRLNSQQPRIEEVQ